jgi:mannose-6-phosphate isomerase
LPPAHLHSEAHPDKRLAEQLFARDPKNYPDDNHKPEMIIALNEMNVSLTCQASLTTQAMCGFRSVIEIAQFLADHDSLRVALGDDSLNSSVLHL